MSYLHRDHLASVRFITNAAGTAEQSTTYTPFGDPDTTTLITQSTPEEHSFIGERFDASTGLLYLNARYYDPALGRFLQPDWWEVRQQGVGTNRYAYSFNDPVNLSDPNGHFFWLAIPAALSVGEWALVGLGIIATAEIATDAYDGQINGNGVIGNGVSRILEPENYANGPNVLMNEEYPGFVTPGGNPIRDHGKKGSGDEYIGNKGWAPEQVDGVISGGGREYETAQGDGSTGGTTGAKAIFGEDGNWVVINDNGEVITVSDREHPERGIPKQKEEAEDE